MALEGSFWPGFWPVLAVCSSVFIDQTPHEKQGGGWGGMVCCAFIERLKGSPNVKFFWGQQSKVSSDDNRYLCRYPEMVAFLAWGTVSSIGHKVVDVQQVGTSWNCGQHGPVLLRFR